MVVISEHEMLRQGRTTLNLSLSYIVILCLIKENKGIGKRPTCPQNFPTPSVWIPGKPKKVPKIKLVVCYLGFLLL